VRLHKACAAAAVLVLLCPPGSAGRAAALDVTDLLPQKLRPKQPSPSELRAAYLKRLGDQAVAGPDMRTLGSLWEPGGALIDLGSDYKARNLHDIVVIQVAVQTTAAQSGSVGSSRQFSANAGITGLPGELTTKGVSTLIGANSASSLKGSGATASNTTFATSLTGEVIAVLPNGNLVVEAQREIFMNNQHENVIIRGVVRPGDISTANTIPSTSLGNLEIELKGKGIISDATRNLNPLTRAVLWLFGF
jgi:flagellar L-ring protein FlgH